MSQTLKKNSFVILPVAALAFGLVLFALQGAFTRFHADDFCMAAAVNRHGFWGAQANWYHTWSGRYAYFLVSSLLTVIGPGFAPFMPLAVVAAWWGGLVIVFRRLRIPGAAFVLPPLALFATLATLPNRFQSVFWLNGMTNYTLPLVLLTFGAGWIAAQAASGRRVNALALSLNLLAALAAGGFSETALAVQITLLALSLAATYLPGWGAHVELRRLLLAWLGGSLLALIIVFYAPGNQVRQAEVGFAAPGVLHIGLFSVRNAAHVAGKYILWHPLAAAASLLLPLALGWLHPFKLAQPSSLAAAFYTPHVQRLALLPLAGFTLVVASCAPTVYAMNAYPDDRVIVVPQYLLALTLILWGLLAGRTLGALLPAGTKRPPALLLYLPVIVLIGAVGLAAVDLINALPADRQYATRWDERHQDLLVQAASGVSALRTISLDSRHGLMELSADSHDWVNRCMAGFYGVESITAGE